jgi:NAD+ kinase
MIVAIYGNTIEKAHFDDILHLIKVFEGYNAKLSIYAPFYEFLCSYLGFKPKVESTFRYPNDIKCKASLMLCIGGDGTLLDSISFVQDSGIPIAGINFGRLGFLARIPISSIKTAVDQLLSGRFTTEKRTVIKSTLEGNPLSEFPYALNDLTIQKRGTSMININAFIDEEFVCNYWSDGIIISTPTGSTAYSLSVGGPIVSPNSETFIISPIAPHNLTIRPLVFPEKSKLRLEVNTRGNQILFSLDSRSVVIPSPTMLTVEKANFCINVVCLEGETYYTTLRNKLMWGIDSRSINT